MGMPVSPVLMVFRLDSVAPLVELVDVVNALPLVLAALALAPQVVLAALDPAPLVVLAALVMAPMVVFGASLVTLYM